MYNMSVNKKITKMFVFCEFLCGLYILFYGEYVSDYLNVETNVKHIYIICFLIFIVFFHYLFLYSWCILSVLFFRKSKLTTSVNINSIFLLLVIIYFIFLLKTGSGKVYADGGSIGELSSFDKLLFFPIIILKLNFLIYIYAAGCKKKDNIYYLVLFIFLICELYRGVSFSILLIALIEIEKIKRCFRIKYLLISLPLFVLFVNIVYNIKFMVRLGEHYDYLDIFQTLIMLLGRLSIISNVLYNYEHYYSVSNFVEGFGYSAINEFLEKLTPMPSLFGITEKTTEIGKLIFYHSYGRWDSAIAISVLGILSIVPGQLLEICAILIISFVFIQLTINMLDNTEQQNTVAFFFIILTLYQGFWGLLANYVYALFIYLIIIASCNLMMSKSKGRL